MEKTEAELANIPDDYHMPDEHYAAVGRPLVDLIGKGTNGLCPEKVSEEFKMYEGLSGVMKSIVGGVYSTGLRKFTDASSMEFGAKFSELTGRKIFLPGTDWEASLAYNMNEHAEYVRSLSAGNEDERNLAQRLKIRDISVPKNIEGLPDTAHYCGATGCVKAGTPLAPSRA